MSEIAVKIYDSKRDIQRIQLKSPVSAKQPNAMFLNPDTKQEITFLRYDRVGRYRLEILIVGKNYDAIRGPYGSVKGEIEVSSAVLQRRPNLLQQEFIYFASIPNSVIPFTGFKDMGPETVIEHYYAVLRYLDD